MLLQNLVNTDVEGLVVEALVHKVLVDAELRSSDGLTLGDPGQVEAELTVMSPHGQELAVMLHWRERRTLGKLAGDFNHIGHTEKKPLSINYPAVICPKVAFLHRPNWEIFLLFLHDFRLRNITQKLRVSKNVLICTLGIKPSYFC